MIESLVKAQNTRGPYEKGIISTIRDKPAVGKKIVLPMFLRVVVNDMVLSDAMYLTSTQLKSDYIVESMLTGKIRVSAGSKTATGNNDMDKVKVNAYLVSLGVHSVSNLDNSLEFDLPLYRMMGPHLPGARWVLEHDAGWSRGRSLVS